MNYSITLINSRTGNQLFYSRRISDPDAGTKITGKIGKNSVGMIAARNRPSDEDGDHPHFGVLRLKRDLGVNSSIGALAVGKSGPLGQQAVGNDLVLSLNDNDKLFLNSAMSFDADTDQDNKMYSGRFRHNSDRFPYEVWGSWIELSSTWIKSASSRTTSTSASENLASMEATVGVPISSALKKSF